MEAMKVEEITDGDFMSPKVDIKPASLDVAFERYAHVSVLVTHSFQYSTSRRTARWSFAEIRRVRCYASAVTYVQKEGRWMVACSICTLIPSQASRQCCPFCDKQFRNEASLKEHMNKKHPKSVNYVQCNECYKYLGKSDNMATHICELK